MFAKPRAKKSILPSLRKKRKNISEVEEVSFDQDARQEFLTGFHKRKLQRIKHAQEVAAKRARQEKIDTRKQIREERKKDLEEHVQNVNRMLREANAAFTSTTIEGSKSEPESGEWDGFPDRPDLELVDHEEEYVDEDRYTTVTIETVSITRDGLSKPEVPEDGEEDEIEESQAEASLKAATPEAEPKRKIKKQFRYESPGDRALANAKQKARSRAKRGK